MMKWLLDQYLNELANHLRKNDNNITENGLK